MGVNPSERATLDIETNGDSIDFKCHGNHIVEILIRGDGAADYSVDVRGGNSEDWIQDVNTYSGSADYDIILETAVPEVRIRCTSGTTVAGDQADVLMSASGG